MPGGNEKVERLRSPSEATEGSPEGRNILGKEILSLNGETREPLHPSEHDGFAHGGVDFP